MTILSFDLEEWQRHWQKELPSHFDILDLGYWYSADNGEPKFAEPDATWRKDIAEGLLKQEKAEADFQPRVAPWMQACFGPEISADRVERNHRFLEEALELVQACGAARETACNSWATSTVALPASPRRKSGA